MRIFCNSLNEATYEACALVLEQGTELESRAGRILECLDVDFVMKNPQNRHLCLNGRANNIFSSIAELFWVMSGDKHISPFLEFFLPRAGEFSDDGGLTWSDSYGERIYKHGQIDNLVRTFQIEGKGTRRGILSIYDSTMDSMSPLREDGKIRAIPCNDTVFYYIRDNNLYSKVAQRSSDIVWGFSNVNLMEFSFLQEIVLGLLKNNCEGFDDVTVGTHTQSIISLHLYDPGTAKQARRIVDQNSRKELSSEPSTFQLKLGSQIKSQKELHTLFSMLYSNFCLTIKRKTVQKGFLENTFSLFEVPTEQNSLFSYAKMIEGYIHSKLGLIAVPEDLFQHSSENLVSAVKGSKFIPEEWLDVGRKEGTEG